jgi:protein involved in polysaccharide export with SLBB domain
MTLSSLLTQAGGISEAGAAVVRVVRSESSRAAVAAGRAPKPGPGPDAPEKAASDVNERSAAPDREAESLLQDLEREASRAGSESSSPPTVASETAPHVSGGGGSEETKAAAGERPRSSPAVRAAFGVTPSGVSLPAPVRLRPQAVLSGQPIQAARPQPRVESASKETGPKPVLLPVVNANIPYRDIALDEGDTVVVEPVQMPLFSVLGLVSKPGNFPYPPGARYNLTQAIAFAGGLDPVARPYYATIYRIQEDGSVARAPFRLISKEQFTAAMATPIRPGDVVAVENTPRTRMNTSIRELLRINAGFYITGQDIWGSNN